MPVFKRVMRSLIVMLVAMGIPPRMFYFLGRLLCARLPITGFYRVGKKEKQKQTQFGLIYYLFVGSA